MPEIFLQDGSRNISRHAIACGSSTKSHVLGGGDRDMGKPAKDILGSAPRPVARPLFFQEQRGNSFSRANSLRPMHHSLRLYHAYSAVIELSLGIMFYIPAFMVKFDADDPLALYAGAILGSCLLMMAALSLAFVALDFLERKRHPALTRQALRWQLQRQKKSYYYVANPKHLRGMKIGAVFFGGLFLMAVFVQILILLGGLEKGTGVFH